MSKLTPKNDEVEVDNAITMQKWPTGVNLVTMKRAGPPIQVKLPTTEKNQYWCSVKVDGPENSIQCPDLQFALKVSVLRQAANLAAKESITVRIPIKAKNEPDDNFGVYAVPGLETHVFVGPITVKLPVSL